MLFLTPLFLQIRICTRFCYTWELSHFKGLLKQKHYPQRTYLRLTFNYCLQCTGDLDKRWHIASRSIHSIHLYGFTYYIPTEQFIFMYLSMLSAPPPHPTLTHHPYHHHYTYFWSLVSLIIWCRPKTVFIRHIKTQNNIPMFVFLNQWIHMNIWIFDQMYHLCFGFDLKKPLL